MKKIMILAVAALLAMSCITTAVEKDVPAFGPAKTDRAVVKEYQNAYSFEWLNYLMYIPPGYQTGNEKYPLIINLHGAGQKGADTEALKAVSLCAQLEDSKKENFPFIVVSPQLPGPEGFEWPYSMDRGTWYPDSFYEQVIKLLDHITASYEVDSSRIYLHGASMGGTAVWKMAMYYPDRFAAAAPCAGEGDPEYAYLLKDLPLWVFHAEGDEIMPVEGSDKMVEAVKAAGGNVTYIRSEGGNHQSAWANDFNDLYKWFLDFHIKD